MLKNKEGNNSVLITTPEDKNAGVHKFWKSHPELEEQNAFQSNNKMAKLYLKSLEKINFNVFKKGIETNFLRNGTNNGKTCRNSQIREEMNVKQFFDCFY